MKRPLVLAVVAALALGGAGTWFAVGQRRAAIAEVARATLPATPDLAGWPADLRRALAEQEALVRAGKDAPLALARLSSLYHANGFFREAGLCYQGLIAIAPDEPRWPHRLAAILAGYGRLDEAIPLWTRVVELDGRHVPALVRLGDALLKTNRAAEAQRCYEQALGLAPDNAHALVGLARLAMAAERWTEARDRLETAAARSGDAIGSDLLATAYERLGEQTRAEMLRGKQKAAGTFSDIPDPWLDELYADCFDTYRIAVASGAAAHGGNFTLASELIERALTLAPDSVPTLFQRGGMRLRQGDRAGARRDFERCTQLDPGFSDGWAQRAALLRQLGQDGEADRVLAEGLRHCPNSAGLRIDNGRRLARSGDAAGALAEFRSSIRLRPEEAEAYLEAARLLFTQEKVAEGVALLETAQRFEPDHPSVLTTLAFAAISSGDETAARQWLRRVRLQPRVPSDARSTLGTAFRDRFGKFAE